MPPAKEESKKAEDGSMIPTNGGFVEVTGSGVARGRLDAGGSRHNVIATSKPTLKPLSARMIRRIAAR